MASLTSLKELATCGICFELFNEDNRCPRMLPCGHTFCHSCLEKILVQSPSCPTCKAEIQTHQADIIPVNYVVKSLVCVASLNNNPSKAQKTNKQKKNTSNSVTSKIDSEGFCTEHSNDKQLRCMDCESWICGTCCVLKHKQCRTLLVKDAYKEFKDHISDKVEKKLESRKSIVDIMEQSLTYLEEQRNKLIEEITEREIELKKCNKKINNLNSLKWESREFSEHLRQVQTEVETSINDAEISKVLIKFDDVLSQGKNWLTQLQNLKLHCIYPITFEDLRKLSQGKREVYVVESEKEPLYGKVTLKGEQLRISSFSPIKPEGLPVPFGEFIQRFHRSTNISNMVYMKIKSVTDQFNIEVDVVIKPDVMSPVVKNFVELCSGINRQTYKGIELERTGKTLTLAVDLPPVEEGISDNYDCAKIINVGSVYVERGLKSKFSVQCVHNGMNPKLGLKNCRQIGVIISGLEEMKRLYNQFKQSIIIVDCGLVIHTNH